MTHPSSFQSPQDIVGRKIAGQLSLGSAQLDHDVSERLRVARLQAVARRKVPEMVLAGGLVASGSGTLSMGENSAPGLWARIGSALPLLALIAGLLAISVVQNDFRANEVAEVDAALLTDDLPATAYTDPGFMQFLRADSDQPTR
jgi:hypothetical protein